MSQPEPLTEQQLDEYAACVAVYQRHPSIGFACCTAHPVADAGAALLAEVRRLRVKTRTLGELAARRESELIARRAELAAVEMLAPQQCPAGLHADWLVDSEYAHACPWCQIDSLRTDAAAELMPVWEAVYEPGNVSDYLIGYMNDQDAATGAAEAWMRSQAEVTGRLEWVPWGDATPMPDGYDRWFELGQQHDDGIDTGTGIVVRRRKEPTPATLAASQPPEAPTEPETATEASEGLLRLSADRVRALAILEAANFLRDAHHRDGLTVQEIGTALRNTADEADPMVGSLARDGFGLDEIAAMLGSEVTPGAHPIADADNPTLLRWGLDDVLWGDDDSITVLLSGPDLEPYRLELDPERAAVLRRNLAGPEGEEGARIALTRSDLAALLAHQADVLAARWRAVAPGAGAWEVAAALSLTSHANELSAEVKRPAVTELLDNIWTFLLEQQAAATGTQPQPAV